MGKSWAVFKRDAKRILRNPVAAVITIGVCVVPCLYAWINVLANWDPYANTSEVPVAVVNEDEPVTLEQLGEVCVGSMMEEALEDNDKIGWLFLDRDRALEGVRSGEYYAAIVIPEDFTQRLTGIIDGKTTKAQLKYYVNEKVNPIAPKVTDTGASTVETTVDNEFVAKVGEVVAQKLGDVGGKIVADSEQALGDESSVLGDIQITLTDVNDQLNDLSTRLGKAQDALRGAANNLSPLEGLGSRVATQLDDLMGNFDDTRLDANKLIADINAALGNGAQTVSGLSTTASTDISAVAGDIAYAQTQLNAAIRALENDLTDSEALVQKLEDARSLVVSIKPQGSDAETLRLDIQDEVDRELDVMAQISAAQQAKLDELRALNESLQTVVTEVAGAAQALDGKVQTAANGLTLAQMTQVSSTLAQVNAALDGFVQVGSNLEYAASSVDPLISQTVSLAQQFADSLSGADDALEGTRTSLLELTDLVDSLDEELSAIRASSAWALIADLVETDPDAVGSFLMSPVEVNEVDLYPVENYGSGIAPFFTSVALWVGGIALVAIFKLEVDEDEVGSLRPWQAYFGRWTLFVLLAVFQALICSAGDLALGIQCVHPWAFFLAAAVASFVFINIIYALSVAFKHLGKALALTLIILQVPGSSGMYPIEMTPSFFQALGPWLPFTYSNNALREAVGGFYGSNYAIDLGMLLLFVAPAILLGVTARSHLVNINALFDKRLRETDHLMVMEPVAIEGNHYRLATVVKALHAPDEYREEFDEYSSAFERTYPTLVRRGLILLAILPLGLFGLMLFTDAKLPAVACFVISIIAIYSFLIVVEFMHDRMYSKRSLTELSAEELTDVLHRTLRDELMPHAPIDAILDRRIARGRDPRSLGDIARSFVSRDGKDITPRAEEAHSSAVEGEGPSRRSEQDGRNDESIVGPDQASKGGDAR